MLKRQKIINRISDITTDLGSLYGFTSSLRDIIKNMDTLEFSVKYHCMCILVHDQERISECIKILYDVSIMTDDLLQYIRHVIVPKFLHSERKSIYDRESEKLIHASMDLAYDYKTIIKLIEQAKSEVGIEHIEKYSLLLALLEIPKAEAIMGGRKWQIDG